MTSTEHGAEEARQAEDIRPRTVDYPFTIIEMRVDNEGRGEGKMSIVTRINFDNKNKVVELEDYASEPVRLYQVRVTKQERRLE